MHCMCPASAVSQRMLGQVLCFLVRLRYWKACICTVCTPIRSLAHCPAPHIHQGLSNPARAASQDVILRGGRQHPLFARVADARAPAAFVLPAQPDRGVQVRGSGRNRAEDSGDRSDAWQDRCLSGEGCRVT